jgi:hypothetical protein
LTKINILFFSRDYQANLFPLLVSEKFNSLHVTLTISEKLIVEKLGGKVIACLETDYPFLIEANISMPYLIFSWGSDRFLRDYKYKERLTIQKKIISFWSNILDEYKPFAVVNEPVVIEVSEILYIETQKRKIKYMSLGYFNNPNSFFWFPDAISNSFKSIIGSIEINKLDQDKAIEYISKIKEDLKPQYVTNLNSRLSVIRLLTLFRDLLIGFYIKIIKRDKIIRQICYGDNLDLYKLNLKLFLLSIYRQKKYNTIFEIDSIHSDKLFYPLHYEPEGVLFYGAYFFDDQLELIKNILKCIGENKILVVKEHPQQPGFLLQEKYLNLRKRYSNVFYLPSEVPSKVLISKCNLLLTLGGTIGFEALVNKIPVINFGSVFYDSFEGVINCKSYHELYKIFRTNYTFKQDSDLIEFTAKILKLTKVGNPHPNTNLTDSNNIKSILNSIISELCI